MPEPVFEVHKDKSGQHRFRLKAANGEVIASGEGYASKQGCLNGIESIKKNAPEAIIVAEGEKVGGPVFETYKDQAGEYRFRLKAANGEVIAVGEGYSSKQGSLNGIELIKKYALIAKTFVEGQKVEEKAKPVEKVEPQKKPEEKRGGSDIAVFMILLVIIIFVVLMMLVPGVGVF